MRCWPILIRAAPDSSEADIPDQRPSASNIELSLFASRIAAICEEMGALLGRVAFSPNIRDRLDYSCALFDPRGRLLGQATHIPVHLGSMAYAMGDLVRGRQWHAGDMVILNDPFQGGTHLPDVTFVAPVFLAGELAGFCANRAHHADIGAEAPGSMPISRDISEEGILISPARLIRGGEMDREMLDGLLGRLNDPAAALGDFNAQIAANRLGADRLAELAGRLGSESLAERCAGLQSYAHRLAKFSLSDLPHGRFKYRDVLDDDGFGQYDIPIQVTLDISRDGITVDFSGTAGQVTGNMNCPLPVTAAAVFYVFRCLMPAQIPPCHGAMQHFSISAPLGCLVNAKPPAAVAAGNVETSMRIVDVVCGALAEAMPGRIPAAGQGTMNNLAMGAREGTGWDYYETLGGGAGAGPDCHGRAARHSHMTNTLNTPVEVLERHYPLRVLRYAQRRGSGGAGEYRGGDGVVREYEFLADAELSILSERRRTSPWGLAGGSGGLEGLNTLDGRPLGGKCQRRVKAGQVLRIETPGGGGYGRAGEE
jgi:N-methylhydantoinase B